MKPKTYITLLGLVLVVTLVSTGKFPTTDFVSNVINKIEKQNILNIKRDFTATMAKMASNGELNNLNNTAEFVKKLQKYMKVKKVCNVDNLNSCWPYDEITLKYGIKYYIKEARNGYAFRMPKNNWSDYTSENIGILTDKGLPMIISYNTKCNTSDLTKPWAWLGTNGATKMSVTNACIAAIFDTNGKLGPNEFGKDVITYGANGLGDSCTIELNGKCFSIPKYPPAIPYKECLKMVEDGSIRGCYDYDNKGQDHYAGAVQMCGGKDKIITMADIAQLAPEVFYDKRIFKPYKEEFSLQYNQYSDLAHQLPSPVYYLWTNQEHSGNSYVAFCRWFTDTEFLWKHKGYRYDSRIVVSCELD